MQPLLDIPRIKIWNIPANKCKLHFLHHKKRILNAWLNFLTKYETYFLGCFYFYILSLFIFRTCYVQKSRNKNYQYSWYFLVNVWRLKSHEALVVLLLGCCTRFLCILTKWYSLLAKIMITPIHSLYPIF